MIKEEYKIEIETRGNSGDSKEYNKTVRLGEREFTALVNWILDFLERHTQEEMIR